MQENSQKSVVFKIWACNFWMYLRPIESKKKKYSPIKIDSIDKHPSYFNFKLNLISSEYLSV